MGEIAFPLCWVRSLPETAHRRGIEHGLDAAADPACRFWLLGPDRIEHLHDQPCIDRRDGQLPQSGVNVGGEGVFPLLPVLRVAPARTVLFDEFGSALAKRAAFRDGEPLCLPLGGLGVERVYPIVAKPAVFRGPSARLCE